MPGTAYTINVRPRIPPRLARLADLAGNLWYSFDRPTRILFARLHPALWTAVGHSPKAMLNHVDERRLVAAAADPAFVEAFDRALGAFDAYMREPVARPAPDAEGELATVAYFCAEFGIHESLPIYSGGLGILAGDHCKAASDRGLSLVAVGLLYRQGYFVQTVDGEGHQHAEYRDTDFDDLPITPALTRDGAELEIIVPLAERRVHARVWRANVGRVTLLLLDTDLASNTDHDRDIAHRLYGGDGVTRLEQEIVLGVGGARALAALAIEPAVWHVNEGHAAFLIVERTRELVKAGLDPDAALEAVAANTVFTTHTPVPAGHDHFADALVLPYVESLCNDCGLAADKVILLGRGSLDGDFNMTALALHGSRHHNGVSQIHGRVTSEMLQGFWPEIPAAENPITAITNGVHLQTFLAYEWTEAFDRLIGADWRHRIGEPRIWEQIQAIPDHIFWSLRQNLKSQMLQLVQQRVRRQYYRNQESESHVDRLLRHADPSNPTVLTIGFARRFATYKRATLLFDDLDTLRAIVGDRERPVVFVFAGKAHPADRPGQELISAVTRLARMPEFAGHFLFVEGYDLRVARRLVTGVDVWLNNPVFPMEASGTSGMKAGINGVINLSVRDGWWEEGYTGDNGWAIKPAASTLEARERDQQEARTIYEILQDQVVPLYYDRDAGSYSPGWLRMAKRSMATLLPRFSASRMLDQYVERVYRPAARQGARYRASGYLLAKDVAGWKARVRAAWPGVAARRVDRPARTLVHGTAMPIEVDVAMNGLRAEDLVVELLLSRDLGSDERDERQYVLTPTGAVDAAGGQRFALELTPELCGHLAYRLRVYPYHPSLTHRFELGLMRWV